MDLLPAPEEAALRTTVCDALAGKKGPSALEAAVGLGMEELRICDASSMSLAAAVAEGVGQANSFPVYEQLIANSMIVEVTGESLASEGPMGPVVVVGSSSSEGFGHSAAVTGTPVTVVVSMPNGTWHLGTGVPAAAGYLAPDLELRHIRYSLTKALAEGEQAARWRARNLALHSAHLVGLIGHIFECTVDYVKIRTQFGRSIGSFQAVQHRLADDYTSLAIGKALTQFTTYLVGRPDVSAARQMLWASGTQGWLAKEAIRLCRNATQFHGGIAATVELPLGSWVRSAARLCAYGGHPDQHLKRVASLLRRGETFEVLEEE